MVITLMIKNMYKIFFVVVVALIVFCGLIFFDFTKEVSLKENRMLAKFPKRSLFHEKFPKEFDEWVNDRVGLRDYATILYSKIENIIPHLNINVSALIGQDNWLFFNSEYNNIYNYSGLLKFPEEKIEKIKFDLKKMSDFAEKNNIKVYFMIPPNKNEIYSEFYPKYINKISDINNYKIMENLIKNNTTFKYIDIYDTLIKEKDNYQLYYKEDNHWTSIGAYFAYKNLAIEINKEFKEFEIINQDILYRCDKKFVMGDLAKILRYNHIYQETNEFCVKEQKEVIKIVATEPYKHIIGHSKIDANKDKKLKIMVFYESFGDYLLPYINFSASEIKYVWFYLSSPLTYEKEILEFKPDIIIWEVQQRFMTGSIMHGLRYTPFPSGVLYNFE